MSDGVLAAAGEGKRIGESYQPFGVAWAQGDESLHGVYRAVILAQRTVDKVQKSERLPVPWIQDDRLLRQFEGVFERILRSRCPSEYRVVAPENCKEGMGSSEFGILFDRLLDQSHRPGIGARVEFQPNLPAAKKSARANRH